MRIWGYLLVVLNIAATGAFVYFAMQVMNARSAWQYAAMKQELVNRGLPVTAPAAEPDADPDFVPFPFQYGEFREEQIAKAKLQKLIPPGGAVLGVKGGQVVANQVDEVKRVQQIVFADLDALGKSERQLRQLILLLNLGRNYAREGIYALLRDFPIDNRRTLARRELAFLGQTAPQQSALQAMAALGETLIGYGPNKSPDEIAERAQAGRKALAAWALSEVAYIAPDPPAPAIPPTGEAFDKPPANADRDRLLDALRLTQADMDALVPDTAKLAANRETLIGMLEGDNGIRHANAANLLPLVAELATNPLDAREKVEAARAKLIELMDTRAQTQAEKDSLAAIVSLMTPAPPSGDEAKDTEVRDTLINTAATALLKIYFEEALAAPSTNDLPDEVASARTKLLGLKPVRAVEEQRRKIAHLLYHLDSHVAPTKSLRDIWYRTFIVPEPLAASLTANPDYKMQSGDEAYLENRMLWHNRVAAVVGLQAYGLIVDEQATQLQRIADDVATRMSAEQDLFTKEYQDVVRETIALAGILDVRQGEQKREEDKLVISKAQLDKELVEQKKQEDILAASTAKARVALTSLEAKVDELFQITQALGNAQDALVGLELKLRDLEIPKKK